MKIKVCVSMTVPGERTKKMALAKINIFFSHVLSTPSTPLNSKHGEESVPAPVDL